MYDMYVCMYACSLSPVLPVCILKIAPFSMYVFSRLLAYLFPFSSIVIAIRLWLASFRLPLHRETGSV